MVFNLRHRSFLKELASRGVYDEAEAERLAKERGWTADRTGRSGAE